MVLTSKSKSNQTSLYSLALYENDQFAFTRYLTKDQTRCSSPNPPNIPVGLYSKTIQDFNMDYLIRERKCRGINNLVIGTAEISSSCSNHRWLKPFPIDPFPGPKMEEYCSVETNSLIASGMWIQFVGDSVMRQTFLLIVEQMFECDLQQWIGGMNSKYADYIECFNSKKKSLISFQWQPNEGNPENAERSFFSLFLMY